MSTQSSIIRHKKDVCLQEKEKKGKRADMDVFVSIPPSMPHRCADLIGSLTLALKLQDHPGERYKGFLSCVPAFNLRRYTPWPLTFKL